VATSIGLVYRAEDCRVPAGAILVSIKICECCGNPFYRKDRDKYCRRCHALEMPLSPVASEILEDLATELPLPQ
jgi:hypothetical protein